MFLPPCLVKVVLFFMELELELELLFRLHLRSHPRSLMMLGDLWLATTPAESEHRSMRLIELSLTLEEPSILLTLQLLPPVDLVAHQKQQKYHAPSATSEKLDVRRIRIQR